MNTCQKGSMYSQNFVKSFQKFLKIFQIFSLPQIVEKGF